MVQLSDFLDELMVNLNKRRLLVIPRVWNLRLFPRCQTQKSLARNAFLFARFGIICQFFFFFWSEAIWWLGLYAIISVFVRTNAKWLKFRTNAFSKRAYKTSESSPPKCMIDAHKWPLRARLRRVNTEFRAYSWPRIPNTGYILKEVVKVLLIKITNITKWLWFDFLKFIFVSIVHDVQMPRTRLPPDHVVSLERGERCTREYSI